MNEIYILSITAAIIGFTHTVFGPDHYLPFVVLSKARRWTYARTIVVTLLCGMAHVASSIILGSIGIAFGLGIFKLKAIESLRGEFAIWFLIIFGFAYFIWGIHRVIRGRAHDHSHEHENEDPHSHIHKHFAEHTHMHGLNSDSAKGVSLTPWILFLVFVLGPCEPLIPLIMFPAVKYNITAVAVVTFVFGFATVFTMLGIVSASYFGLAKVKIDKVGHYSHALAGMAIFLCGGFIKVFGL